MTPSDVAFILDAVQDALHELEELHFDHGQVVSQGVIDKLISSAQILEAEL